MSAYIIILIIRSSSFLQFIKDSLHFFLLSKYRVLQRLPFESEPLLLDVLIVGVVELLGQARAMHEGLL